MKLLVDTHILLWVLSDSPRLSASHKLLLQDTNNEKWVSQCSFMELAIKLKIGKLPDFVPNLEEVIRHTQADGFGLLPLRNEHIYAYQKVPLFPDHRDPFDRFIIATALSEKCTIVTADSKFKLYETLLDVVLV